MKATIFIILLAMAGNGDLLAQQVITINDNPPPRSNSEAIFQGPVPSDYRIVISFNLGNSNRMILYLREPRQIKSLPAIDSLVRVAWQDIQAIGDTLENPLYNYRVDYNPSPGGTKVRYLSYPPKGNVYSVNGTDITQLKVEQDTVHIRMLSPGHISYMNRNLEAGYTFYMRFLLNNLHDLGNINPEKLAQTVALMKSELPDPDKNEKYPKPRYAATYDVDGVKRISPAGKSIELQSRKRITVLPPYTQAAIQYARGTWVPSAGVGLGITSMQTNGFQKQYILIWEPYFFFARNEKNELLLNRNDFISFRYHTRSHYTIPSKTIEFQQTLSIGYLAGKRGEWLHDHTVKFSLSGLHTNNIILEPAFFFNDFFQHFSPSIKLVIKLE